MFKKILKYTVLPVIAALVIGAVIVTQTPVLQLAATASAPEPAPTAAPVSSIVKTGSFSAKGSIQAPDAVSVLAPMGGQVGDFNWSQGDTVQPDALAFEIKPTMVYAGTDGVVRSLKANVGDRVADVVGQYGALCHIERGAVWHIDASTSGAYDDPDNRDIRVGQPVRVQHGTGDSKVRGEGTVISVDGKDYVVELPQGDFELEDSVKIYFDTSKDNASKDQIGSGKIIRAEALKHTGEGVVAAVLVGEGDAVTRGQPLFILDSESARYEAGVNAASEVRFTQSALIEQVLVAPGQFIKQGEAVMTLLPTGALEGTLEVDELDISKVRVGQTLRVKVDSFDGERGATVSEIRPIGQTVLDTTKFLVKVEFDQGGDLMIGMHITGYFD